jgi:hypothetical protein
MEQTSKLYLVPGSIIHTTYVLKLISSINLNLHWNPSGCRYWCFMSGARDPAMLEFAYHVAQQPAETIVVEVNAT